MSARAESGELAGDRDKNRGKLLQLALARGLKRRTAPSTPPLVAITRDATMPCSHAQQGMWLLTQLEGASAAYHMAGGIRLRGSLDRAVLLRSLNEIVARHEALRTTFVRSGNHPVQRIAPAEVGFTLAPVELSHEADRDGALQRVMQLEADTPFDLERGPLIRGRLLRLSPQDHALLVTMHHIVSDGWSLSIFVDELCELYAAHLSGRPSRLQPLPIQYADYAVWQREWLASGVGEQQTTYWRSTLAGAPTVLDLPADQPRPASQDFECAVMPVRLSAELVQSLKTLSQRHGVTLYMTLLAGWAVLLARLSGEQQVVIGSPSANRRSAELESLIGLFVNTLALRIDLTGAPSVQELLARVKATSLGAQQHQDLPFEQVVEMLQPIRSLAHAPVFQAMFSWQNTPPAKLQWSGAEVSWLPGVYVATQFDLSLSLAESGAMIAGNLAYATSLFATATIERYLGYWRQILESMLVDEVRSIDTLALLDGAQRHQILSGWNATVAEYPREQCIHELIESQVRRTPDAIALEFADRQLSYHELNRSANQLAHHLRSVGVGPDSRVALCMERSVAMLVSVLAILKAGGAYVPLDPGYPSERLAFMLMDSAPAAVLIDDAGRSVLREHLDGLTVIATDDAEQWHAQPHTDPDRGSVGLHPHHLAYLIYTSGSTGVPKGVMVEHGNVVNFLVSMQRSPGMQASDRVLALTSLSFDIAGLELYLPLLCGARLVLGSRADAVDAKRLAALLQQHEITVLQGTPALWRLLLEARWPGRAGLTALCGGEALNCQLASEVRARVARLWNLYGPTETTIWSTSALIESRAAEGKSHESIGQPIANTRIYILDARLEPVGIGIPGEIYIAGTGVARGYLNRPELTAQRFLPDPFAGQAAARMYRTGDLGRWRADGSIEFLGRNDHQVKIRGFNIELGDIEAQLRRHPGIADAVVVAREEAGRDKRLVAYYLGTDLAGVELRRHVAAALPQYMVPTIYTKLEAWPLTPNGKLDRAALPAPVREASPRQQYEAPRGEIEEALARMWQELLHLERVSRHDHFFELGGHSLTAVALQTRIKRLGAIVPMTALFQNPTLQSLATYILCRPVADAPVDASVMLATADEASEDAVQMRDGSAERRPLFIVHERTGEVQPLFPLANALDESLPVIGLMLTNGALLQSVEDLAARHVRTMRREQPHGAYRIAGHSFGGLVAYEIARQLQRDGASVEFIGLIDCTRPTLDLRGLVAAEQNISEVTLLATLVNFLHPAIEPEVLAELERIAELDAAVALAKVEGLLPDELMPEQIRRWTRNWRASHAAMMRYTPLAVDLDVHQFLAGYAPLDGDESHGWRALLGRHLHCIPVGGSHFTIIMQPTVTVLAREISVALERIERSAVSSSTAMSQPVHQAEQSG